MKLGFLGPLSGAASELGVSGRNGFTLAVEELNSRGGIADRVIQPVISDDANEAATAAVAIGKFAENDVRVVIGPFASAVASSARAAAAESGILLISPTVSTSSLAGVDDNFFMLIGANREQGVALAEQALASGVRTVTALYEVTNAAYSLELTNYFEAAFAAKGGKILESIPFTSSAQTSFTELAARLIRSRPDALLSITSGRDNARLCQALTLAGSPLPVYAGTWSMTGDLVHQGGRTVERMILAGIMGSEEAKAEFLPFQQAYESRFGMKPVFSSVLAHEAVTVVAEALAVAPAAFSASDAAKAILSVRSFKGLLGDLVFSDAGDNLRPYRVFTIRQGSFVPVK
ncbi:MAG: amino acid ABC transporter substrate-binding protein [Candidatus Competibacteraceae bacterium]|nr:amino acid ABC transporter substrate-binding protein [Candidatus Competibacteraceae bacterium]